jgi:hypothetical protein
MMFAARPKNQSDPEMKVPGREMLENDRELKEQNPLFDPKWRPGQAAG